MNEKTECCKKVISNSFLNDVFSVQASHSATWKKNSQSTILITIKRESRNRY